MGSKLDGQLATGVGLQLAVHPFAEIVKSPGLAPTSCGGPKLTGSVAPFGFVALSFFAFVVLPCRVVANLSATGEKLSMPGVIFSHGPNCGAGKYSVVLPGNSPS